MAEWLCGYAGMGASSLAAMRCTHTTQYRSATRVFLSSWQERLNNNYAPVEIQPGHLCLYEALTYVFGTGRKQIPPSSPSKESFTYLPPAEMALVWVGTPRRCHHLALEPAVRQPDGPSRGTAVIDAAGSRTTSPVLLAARRFLGVDVAQGVFDLRFEPCGAGQRTKNTNKRAARENAGNHCVLQESTPVSEKAVLHSPRLPWAFACTRAQLPCQRDGLDMRRRAAVKGGQIMISRKTTTLHSAGLPSATARGRRATSSACAFHSHSLVCAGGGLSCWPWSGGYVDHGGEAFGTE